MRALLIWGLSISAFLVPVGLSLASPLLQWRQPIYIAAGLSGVIAMGLLLMQPLLAAGLLPGLRIAASKKFHFWVGLSLVLFVTVHLVGLWITSPPDVIDALLFRSPTPFAPWGVVALVAIFSAGISVILPKRMKPRSWRRLHAILVCVAIATTIVHAVLIDGTMETVSKYVLALCILATTYLGLRKLRIFPWL